MEATMETATEAAMKTATGTATEATTETAMEEKREVKICQSCGMPMSPEQYGVNEDGSRNEKYCCYCLQDGKLGDCTLEEMVDICAPFEVEGGRCKTIEEAKTQLMQYLPTLERWKQGNNIID